MTHAERHLQHTGEPLGFATDLLIPKSLGIDLMALREGGEEVRLAQDPQRFRVHRPRFRLHDLQEMPDRRLDELIRLHQIVQVAPRQPRRL